MVIVLILWGWGGWIKLVQGGGLLMQLFLLLFWLLEEWGFFTPAGRPVWLYVQSLP